MDLIAIMNERVRSQSHEHKMALYRLMVVTFVAVVAFAEMLASLQAAIRAGAAGGAECIVTVPAQASEVSSSCGVPLERTFLWRAICWAAGNIALVIGMSIAVHGQSRLSAVGRIARFWIPARADVLDTAVQPPAVGTGILGRIASHPLSVGLYFAAIVIVFMSIAGSGTSFFICATVQILQIVLYGARCKAWRSSAMANGAVGPHSVVMA